MTRRSTIAGPGSNEVSPTALLLVDVIHDMEFEPADAAKALCEHFAPVARRLVKLRERCHAAGVAVIYVNDNFGRWTSDFHAVVSHCCDEGRRGAELSRLLRPGGHDYFVLKPRHSGFFHTSLELLLQHLAVESLIITGVAGNNCVLFTASDAYLRGYKVTVPRDGIADEDPADTERAIAHMQKVLKADTTPVDELRLDQRVSRGG